MICEPVELPDAVSDVDGVTEVDVDVDVDAESELELGASKHRYYYNYSKLSASEPEFELWTNMDPVTHSIRMATSFCLPKVNLLMARAIRFMIPVRHSNATNGHLFLGIITLRKNSYSQISRAKNRIIICGAAPILLIGLDGNLVIQWKS